MLKSYGWVCDLQNFSVSHSTLVTNWVLVPGLENLLAIANKIKVEF